VRCFRLPSKRRSSHLPHRLSAPVGTLSFASNQGGGGSVLCDLLALCRITRTIPNALSTSCTSFVLMKPPPPPSPDLFPLLTSSLFFSLPLPLSLSLAALKRKGPTRAARTGAVVGNGEDPTRMFTCCCRAASAPASSNHLQVVN
jgi:hypothetical protein